MQEAISYISELSTLRSTVETGSDEYKEISHIMEGLSICNDIADRGSDRHRFLLLPRLYEQARKILANK